MSRIIRRLAVLISQPLPVPGPGRSEKNVSWARRDPYPTAAFQVRGPNLVPGTRRKMISHTPAIGTQAEAIRKTILGPSELARLGAVQIHAEDLADLVANNLHQHP